MQLQNMLPIRDIDTLDSLIEKYYAKGCRTNNYLMIDAYVAFIDANKLFYVESGNNLVILVFRDGFYQLYFYLNNLTDLFVPNCHLPLTIEIVYRGERGKLSDTISYWTECGFREHLTRRNMTGSYSQLQFANDDARNCDIKLAETGIEIEYVQALFAKTLDRYTGDIPKIEEVRALARNQNVICAFWRGVLCGALHFEVQNRIVWLRHVAVDAQLRGKGIAKSLLNRYIKLNAISPETRYQLWVVQDNVSAASLYEKFGFKYTNKSTVSMLRK